MKASELINELIDGAITPERTCDTVKAGDAEKEIKKVAVSMFATVDIIRQVTEWGADMLIVHEPTYYNHMEIVENETDVIRARFTVRRKLHPPVRRRNLSSFSEYSSRRGVHLETTSLPFRLVIVKRIGFLSRMAASRKRKFST